MRATAASIVLPAIVLALGACASAHQVGRPGVEAAQAREAIDTTWRAHIAAGVAKDIDGVVAMYADDMVYIVPDAEEVRGIDALRRMERETLAKNDVLHATHVIDALTVHGDIAYELGTVTGPVRPRGGQAQVFTFHFMAQWVRGVDGVWRMRFMIGQG